MLDPSNKPLAFCSKERIEWYLRKGLAEIVDHSDYYTIRLFNSPSDRDYESNPLILVPMENKCVCCGSEENLTRHHVVPKCFRKHFPINYKNHFNHDVLILCDSCHKKYTVIFQKYIESMTEFKNDKETIIKYKEIKGLAYRLIRDKSLSSEEINGFRDQIKEYSGNEDPVCFLNNFVPDEVVRWARSVVNKLVTSSDFEDFIRGWRSHFVETMNPEYLPKEWKIENPVKNGT